MSNINESISLEKAFGLAIQRAREACGYTLSDMVDKMGISYERYLRFEGEYDNFSINELDSIAAILNTTVSELFDVADEIRFKN